MTKLSQLPLFQGIAKEEIPRLLSSMQATQKKYQQQEIILLQGSTLRNFGILIEGSVQIVRDDYDGNHRIVTRLEEGDIFGEVYACLQVEQLPLGVEACTKCEVLWIEFEKMMKLDHQYLTMNMMRILAQKNYYFNQKLTCLEKMTTRQKVLTYLQQQALEQRSHRIQLTFSKKELAEYLCVNRSGLMVELKRLEQDGIIKINGRNIELTKGENYDESSNHRDD